MGFKFTKEILEQGLSYKEYRDLIDNLLSNGKTTGDGHPESYVEFTKVNVHRMERIDRTFKIESDSLNFLNNIDKKLLFVVLSEAWCGDAAWNLPVINKIAESSENIQLKVFLRDRFPEIMDNYLTNGGKAIPKLVCLEEESLKELFVWGPRPEGAANIMIQWKKNQIGEKSEALANIQKWYGKDRGKSVLNEIVQLIKNI